MDAVGHLMRNQRSFTYPAPLRHPTSIRRILLGVIGTSHISDLAPTRIAFHICLSTSAAAGAVSFLVKHESSRWDRRCAGVCGSLDQPRLSTRSPLMALDSFRELGEDGRRDLVIDRGVRPLLRV